MTDQILRNTTDFIEIDVYFNNQLTNVSSITIREIIDPDGVVILTNQAVLSGSTTGRYRYEVDSDYTEKLGVYTAIWRFVIEDTTFEHTQYYQVVSSIQQGYITPYDVRENALYEEITDNNPSDKVLQRYINRATQIIDTYLGGSISYGIYTEKVRCVLDKPRNGVHIQLHKKPLISLTSVQLQQSPQLSVSLNVDRIRINESSGYLEYFNNISAPSLQICTFDPTATQIIPMATVVYTAGYVTTPEPVKQAAVMIVEELYKASSGNDMDTIAYKVGDTSERYGRSKGQEDAMNQLGLSGSESIIKLLRPFCHPFTRVGLSGPLG